MRLFFCGLLTAITTGCTHTPPIYTASGNLISSQTIESVIETVDLRVDLSDRSVTFEQQQYNLIKQYTSALGESCIKYVNNNDKDLHEHVACANKNGEWRSIHLLNGGGK